MECVIYASYTPCSQIYCQYTDHFGDTMKRREFSEFLSRIVSLVVLTGMLSAYPTLANQQAAQLVPTVMLLLDECSTNETSISTFQNLAFPFETTGTGFSDAKNISQIQAYGISPWGSNFVHNGVDIIPDNTGAYYSLGDTVSVYSPIAGKVVAVISGPPNPEDAVMIVIQPDSPDCLWVTMTLEPQKTAGSVLTGNSITKSVNDYVTKGELVGHLLIGNDESGPLAKSGRPHVDMRLIAIGSDVTFLRFLAQVIDAGGEDGVLSHDDMSSTPTALCPYTHSDATARSTYDAIFARADAMTQCTCACEPLGAIPPVCGSCVD